MLTNFSWTQRYEYSPELFRENSGTQTWKTSYQMRMVPRMILILKWDPPSISPIFQMIETQMRLPTTVFLNFCRSVATKFWSTIYFSFKNGFNCPVIVVLVFFAKATKGEQLSVFLVAFVVLVAPILNCRSPVSLILECNESQGSHLSPTKLG